MSLGTCKLLQSHHSHNSQVVLMNVIIEVYSALLIPVDSADL